MRFIYDGDGSQYGLEGPTGSGRIEQAFEDHFEKVGLTFTGTPFDGRSDYGPFIQAGVPSGAYSLVQGQCLSHKQVNMAGVPV